MQSSDNPCAVLILYATTDGHTLQICEVLAESLQRAGNAVSIVDLADGPQADLTRFDKIAIGASIRYGKHGKAIYDLIARERETLASRPSVFFSVNLVARKSTRDQPQSNPYVKKFLSQIDWVPDHVGVFAGKLNYPIYSFLDRLVIRLIMKMTGGPTDPHTVREYTDWEVVEAFAEKLHALPVAR